MRESNENHHINAIKVPLFFDLTYFQRLGQKSLQNFCCYFGRNDDLTISFRPLLTFNIQNSLLHTLHSCNIFQNIFRKKNKSKKKKKKKLDTWKKIMDFK